MRAMAVVVALMLFAGCGSGSNRKTARNVLIGFVVVSAVAAVGTAVVGHGVEKDLRRDYEAGGLAGRQFADKDADGERWNRWSRASLFVTGLSVIGLGIMWEMSEGARLQTGPREKTPGDDKSLIFPVPAHSSAAAK